MDKVLFVANTRLIHGEYMFARAGDQAVIPENVAKQLVDANLGTIKAKPKMANKMLPDSTQGNADGSVASSQSSQAAPPSPPTTPNSSGTGKQGIPKRGA